MNRRNFVKTSSAILTLAAVNGTLLSSVAAAPRQILNIELQERFMVGHGLGHLHEALNGRGGLRLDNMKAICFPQDQFDYYVKNEGYLEMFAVIPGSQEEREYRDAVAYLVGQEIIQPYNSVIAPNGAEYLRTTELWNNTAYPERIRY